MNLDIIHQKNPLFIGKPKTLVTLNTKRAETRRIENQGAGPKVINERGSPGSRSENFSTCSAARKRRRVARTREGGPATRDGGLDPEIGVEDDTSTSLHRQRGFVSALLRPGRSAGEGVPRVSRRLTPKVQNPKAIG